MKSEFGAHSKYVFVLTDEEEGGEKYWGGAEYEGSVNVFFELHLWSAQNMFFQDNNKNIYLFERDNGPGVIA